MDGKRGAGKGMQTTQQRYILELWSNDVQFGSIPKNFDPNASKGYPQGYIYP